MKTIVLLCTLAIALAAAENPISLNPQQRTKLMELIKTDKEAKARFETLKRAADKALNDKPNPIRVIQGEGKFKTDPLAIKTRESLGDMRKMYFFAYIFAATGDTQYADKAREFILAWAQQNMPTGNPIDETTLDDLFFAFDLTQSQFSSAEKKIAQAWMRKVADTQIAIGLMHARKGDGISKNNWQSHRLKIVGLIGYTLAEKKYIDYAVEGFKRQIEVNLRSDGSSIDFHERDALHYHCYDIEPLLELAIVANNNGTNLYTYKSKSGASLEKSVKFLLPFCSGEKKHPEFVKSTVAFDRKRAESGDENYKAGHLFDPKKGGHTLELAAAFDKNLSEVYCQATARTASIYPSWQFVINAAREK
jgi:hypothetical protein